MIKKLRHVCLSWVKKCNITRKYSENWTILRKKVRTKIGVKISIMFSMKRFRMWNWFSHLSNSSENASVLPCFLLFQKEDMEILVLLWNSSTNNEARLTKVQKSVTTAMTKDCIQILIVKAGLFTVGSRFEAQTSLSCCSMRPDIFWNRKIFLDLSSMERRKKHNANSCQVRKKQVC